MTDSEAYVASSWILDAVERWAEPSQWLIRETIAGVEGRIDGLLLPVSFDAPVLKRRGYWTEKLGLLGVEVKASRADYLRGLREEQFARYDKSLAGLFVATTRAVKTSEVPTGIGHLVCYSPPGAPRLPLRCACRRLPTVRDWQMDSDTMWRLVFFASKQAREAEARARQRHRRVLERIGEMAAARVFAILKTAEEPE